MSLDVYVSSKCEHCGHSEEHGSFNYTYNLGQLWRDALAAVGEAPAGVQTCAANEAFGKMFGTEKGLSFGEWLQKADKERKMTAGDILPVLKGMLAWMVNVDLSKYDSANGWGDGAGGRSFVEQIAECCEANPRARVTVWR